MVYRAAVNKARATSGLQLMVVLGRSKLVPFAENILILKSLNWTAKLTANHDWVEYCLLVGTAPSIPKKAVIGERPVSGWGERRFWPMTCRSCQP
jgi:hypothetical protein